MRKLLALCGLLVASLYFASMAHAQATRTWVSGVGDDVNPCSRTAPCKTFAGAISKTAAGGEINALDPGGYGAVTITKSMTINGAGTLASVLAPSTNGITVNGAGVIVTLRNLDIEGAGTGFSGIRFLQGASLVLENITIRNFRSGTATGIEFTPSTSAELFVKNVTVSGSGNGPTGAGIIVRPVGGGTVSAVLDEVSLVDNVRGILASGTGSSGTINVTIGGSVVAGSTNHGVLVAGGSGVLNVTLDSVTAAGNGQGIGLSGAAAMVRVGNSTIVSNGTGIQVASGTIQSFKNNQVAGNVNNGTPITAVPGGPLN